MASRRGSSFPSYSQDPFVGHDLLEDQNEQMESHLKDKVSQLNDIAIKIGMELKDQENLTNGLNDSFNNVSSIITNTTGKVRKMLKSQSNYHIRYLLLFCLFVFLVLWLYVRWGSPETLSQSCFWKSKP